MNSRLTLASPLFWTGSSSGNRPKHFTSSLTPSHHVLLRLEKETSARDWSGGKVHNFTVIGEHNLRGQMPTSAKTKLTLDLILSSTTN